ncbi:hypothetical protein ACOSP7_028396 [Xanthoceras sorbifolium]
MDIPSLLRRRGTSKWDIEGQTQKIDDHLDHHDHTRTRSFIALPIDFICKGCELLGTYKKRALGMFFLMMEAVSVVLEVIGKTKLKFLVAAFVLSSFGFGITLHAHFKRRTNRSDTATAEVPAEKQLRMLELVFSSIQLIASFIDLLLACLKVANNFDASVFPLAFAMVAVVFIFENDEIWDPLNDFPEKCPPGGADSVIIYTTSMRGVRRTYEDCYLVRTMFELHGVVFDERDLSLHGAFLSELRKLLDEERPSVPQVFLKGRYIGGAKELGELNESGRLGRMLRWARVEKGSQHCEGCGGSRFVPCLDCGGSCRVALNRREKRCEKCNENGLVRCQSCL